MKKYKKITEADFKNIHLLKKVGLTPSQAATATGRSYATIKKVYETTSFADYKSPPKVTEPAKPQEDFALVISKLETIESCLNQLLEVIKDKEAKANAGFWRR